MIYFEVTPVFVEVEVSDHESPEDRLIRLWSYTAEIRHPAGLETRHDLTIPILARKHRLEI